VKKEMSEEMAEHLKKKNLDIEDEINNSMAEKLVLAKARIPLASLPLTPNQAYPIFIPVPKINYAENDLLRLFFESVNRDNIYLLGSVSYKPEPWYNLGFKLERLDRVRIAREPNSSYEDYEDRINSLKFGVVMEITRKKDNGNIQSLYKHESMMYRVKQTDNNTILFREGENCSFVFEDTNPSDDLTINVSLQCYQSGDSEVIAKKSLPIKKYFNTLAAKPDQSQVIELNLARDPNINFDFLEKEVKEFPIKLEFKVSTDYSNVFGGKKKTKEITKTHNTKFDFRQNSLEEMMAAIVNTKSKPVLIETMKEINEYLLYTVISHETEIPQALQLYQMFCSVYKYYSDDNRACDVAIRNILGLFNFNPSLIFKVNLAELLDDFNELIVRKLKDSAENQEEIQKAFAEFKFTFTVPGIKDKYQEVPLIDKEKINKIQPADLSKYIKNNSLYKGTNEESSEEFAQKSKSLTKIFLYIMKVIDVVSSQGEQFTTLIAQKCLKSLTQAVSTYIKTDVQLLTSYLKVLRKLTIEIEGIEIQPQDANDIAKCLEKIEIPKEDAQTEYFLGVYSEIQGIRVTQAQSAPKKKLIYREALNHLLLNYKPKDLFFHYQLFEIFLNLFEQNKAEVDFIQDTVTRIEIYPKLVNYLDQIIKVMEEKLCDAEIKQALFLLEEILIKYEIKNVNYDRLINYLQLIENKGGINSALRLKTEFVINKLKREREGDSLNKTKKLKEKLKTIPKDNKSKDVNTKYLISKLDWM